MTKIQFRPKPGLEHTVAAERAPAAKANSPLKISGRKAKAEAEEAKYEAMLAAAEETTFELTNEAPARAKGRKR